MRLIQKSFYDLDKLNFLIDDPNIEIIKNNNNYQELFNEKYYSKGFPKIVLCGINPGKLGAGKTGIPFVDPYTLAERLPDEDIPFEGKGVESSATLFNKIVDKFDGADFFYKNFYVTNFSQFGFVNKNGNNLNYYKLSDQAQDYISENFRREMEQINATTIIPMGKEVEKSLKGLFKNSKIKIENRLIHPSGVRSEERKVKFLDDYYNLLEPYTEKNN